MIYKMLFTRNTRTHLLLVTKLPIKTEPSLTGFICVETRVVGTLFETDKRWEDKIQWYKLMNHYYLLRWRRKCNRGRLLCSDWRHSYNYNVICWLCISTRLAEWSSEQRAHFVGLLRSLVRSLPNDHHSLPQNPRTDIHDCGGFVNVHTPDKIVTLRST